MGPGLPAAPEGQQGETESDASEGGGLGCVGGSADGDVVEGCVFDPATVNDEGDAGDGRSGDGSEEAEGVRCLREGEAADESTGGVIDGNDRGAELVGRTSRPKAVKVEALASWMRKFSSPLASSVLVGGSKALPTFPGSEM